MSGSMALRARKEVSSTLTLNGDWQSAYISVYNLGSGQLLHINVVNGAGSNSDNNNDNNNNRSPLQGLPERFCL